MAIIEGYWDCPYCESKGIRGREQKCPNCGKTRASETKFYMRETTPVADLSAVEKGPDWFCPYCDSYNPHSATHCKNCGHERDAEDKDYFEVRQEQTRKAVEKKDEYERIVSPSYNRKSSVGTPSVYSSVSPSHNMRTKRTLPTKRILAIVLLLALLATGIYALLPHDRTVFVTDKHWERKVDVEEYRLVEDDGWYLPSDAVELLRTAREIHHYDQVLDHYETVTEQKSRQAFDGYDTYTTYNDLGNGYFESVEHQTPRYRTEYYTETHEEPVYRSVPVYETKYYYTIWKWAYDRTETASGTTDPHWPDVSYADNEREGNTSEKYTVICENGKGKQNTYSCELDIWSALDIGQKYSVRIQTGKIIELKG